MNPVRPEVPAGQAFSMIMLSDTQYPWYELGDVKYCSSRKDIENPDDCGKREGKRTNREQLMAISKIGRLKWPAAVSTQPQHQPAVEEPIARAAGLVLNGDITAFGRAWQFAGLSEIVRESNATLIANLEADVNASGRVTVAPYFGVFLGLGNHDYRNNVCDCQEGLTDYNSCARYSLDIIRKTYSDVSWIAYDKCSKAYAFDIGGYRFIQLHLYPGYEADLGYWESGGAGIFGEADACKKVATRFAPEQRLRNDRDCDGNWAVFHSWDWLKAQVEEAESQNKWSILLYHAPGPELEGNQHFKVHRTYAYWSPAEEERLKTFVKEHYVAAIFAGHLHSKHGQFKLLHNKAAYSVPVVLSGASEYNTFVVAEFGAGYLRYGVISSAGTETVDPSFLSQASGGLLSKRTFPANVIVKR